MSDDDLLPNPAKRNNCDWFSESRSRFRLIIVLLLALGACGVWADTPENKTPAGMPRSIESKAARPGADFPDVDSYYPPQAKRAGEEGSAVVHVCVDPTGKLTEPPSIVSSSGNETLDAAALQVATAGNGHYLPASENGTSVRGCAQLKIAFKLHSQSPVPPKPGPDFPNVDTYYPMEARVAGQQGAAVVYFCVDPTGTLAEPPTIATSSGNQILDAAAVSLATAGSGHYLPASANGIAVPGCNKFRISFKLTDPLLAALTDPRFPTIAARVAQFDAEFKRRMEGAMNIFGPNARPVLIPTYPDSASVIRQYARAAESAIDQCAAISADYLDDVDYLARSPDIPASERSAFSTVWPEQRAAFAAKMRELLGATRDLVRLTDELADYVAFTTPQRLKTGAAGTTVESQISAQDPQIIAIQERARSALERLRSVAESMGATAPGPLQ